MKFRYYSILLLLGIVIIGKFAISLPVLYSGSVLVMGNAFWIIIVTGVMVFDKDVAKKRKALSPVVTTVILVATAITVAVAVTYIAYWVGNYQQSPENTMETDVRFTDENGTSVYVYRYNSTLYIDYRGVGYLIYNNGTHNLAKKLLASGWEVIGGN